MKNKILILCMMTLILATPMSVSAMPRNFRDGRSARASIKPQIFEKGLFIADSEYVPREIIVKFKAEVGDEVISDLISKYGTSISYTSPFASFKRLRIPMRRTVPEMVRIFSEDPNVEYAEPNYIAHAFMVPNDEFYSYQWHFKQINMEEAWETQTGSPEVIVAIIDTGVAYEDHQESRFRKYYLAPDLAETSFEPGYDFVNDDSHPNDDSGHGTHVCGTVAQSTNNNTGVAGVAFETSIMPVKVLDSNGEGTYADVADGIRYAADHGADVINLSLGGSADSELLEDAVKYAYENGVTIIAAAGNDGSSTISYPAAYDDYVIAVGATQYDETLAPYSNFGPSLDLVAPGGNLNLDQNYDGYGDGVLQNTFNPNTKDTSDFGYWFFHGTSMASPHVAGVAALVLANGNAGTPDEVRAILQKTAKDLGDSGWDETYGCGLVDAYAALRWIPGDVNGDGIVDGFDLSRMCKAYGSEPGDPNWDEDCDINRDDIVSGADLAIACKNYRKTLS